MNNSRCPQPSIPSRKATVLIIGPTPPPYMGPSVATKMILESELQDRFHLLHLDTADRRSLTNIGKLDFSNIYLAFFHILKFLAFLVRFSPRIVYLPICQTIKGYLRDTVFITLSKIFGARVVIHLRGGYFRALYEKSNIFAQLVIIYSLKLVSGVIVLGESLKYIFEGFVSSKRIAVVPNGIDRNYITEAELHKFRNDQYKSMNSKNQRILFLSNLMKSKGFFDVIKAIPEVTKPHDNVKFLFTGVFRESINTRKEVDQYIYDHNLMNYIEFIGTATGRKKRDLLLSSNIFVMPTYYHAEGQPWVIIEAMAAGLPIITTDQGCIKEMVNDGENGFIIEKQNPHQIAEKIISLVQNEQLRKEMGRKSRARFLKYYTKEKFINKLSDVFTSVLLEWR